MRTVLRCRCRLACPVLCPPDARRLAVAAADHDYDEDYDRDDGQRPAQATTTVACATVFVRPGRPLTLQIPMPSGILVWA